MTVDKSRVTVRIVDDDGEVREAEEFLLTCKGWKVASYGSAREFLTKDSPSAPGCLVLDIRMPEMSGIELQREMIARGQTLPIIFLTGHGNVEAAVKALKRGASDFLQKPADSQRLLEAIEAACDLSLLQAAGELSGREASRVLSEMSPREQEVVSLIRDGLTNRAISERIGLAERTVQGHRNNIYHKLRVHNEESLFAAIERAQAWSRSLGQ